MSICRWSENSDVYIYNSQDGYVCCECSLPEHVESEEVICPSAEEMIEHLAHHVDAGDVVPRYALNVLDKLRGDNDGK